MTGRKSISAACMLAFAVVLLHSAIPHSHHCAVRENHIHHLYNCGQLDTFLQGTGHGTVHVFPVADALAGQLFQMPVRPGTSELRPFDTGCRFMAKPAEILQRIAPRGPPCK